jgi:hypothetical protein
MAYKDFTQENIEAALNLRARPGTLFSQVQPVAPPLWLREALTRGLELALQSEKARSEFIVAPILLASRELSGNIVAIFSGQRLDVDPEKGLVGECDFILTLSDPQPWLRAPLLTILEAKKGDIEAGLVQCMAQMAAAQLFNERAGLSPPLTIYGCITTGEDWQFLRLQDQTVTIDRTRLYLSNIETILGMFQAIVAANTPHSTQGSEPHS